MGLRTKHFYGIYYGIVSPSPAYTAVTVGNAKKGKQDGRC